MSLLNNRIFIKDDATITDRSIELSNISTDSVTLPVASATSAIIVGSDHPFNNRYFLISTVNSNTVTLKTEIWNGSAFIDTVDNLDQTNGFKNSNIFSWVPDRDDSSWIREQRSSEDPVTDLDAFTVYDMYWARITWDSDLSGGTALKYVGFRFADDDDLSRIYPEFLDSDFLAQFESGKTDWNEQHIEAAEAIIRILRSEQILWSENQIIEWEQFMDASRHKVADIIFREFGDDYADNRKVAIADFRKALNLKQFRVDKDRDGRLDLGEKRHVVRYIRR